MKVRMTTAGLLLLLALILLVGVNLPTNAGQILDLSYYQRAVLDATKINPDYKIACPQVYKQALYDGKVEKLTGPDGKPAPVQMHLARIYWNCMKYWSERETRRASISND